MPIPFLPNIAGKFVFGRWKLLTQREDYSYDNVKVYFSKYIKIPRVGGASHNRMYESVCKLIEEKKLQFDIIHSHFTYTSGYIGARIKRKYNKPMFLTIHEDSRWFRDELITRRFEYVYAWRNADKIIRVNRKDIKYLKLVMGINAHYIPNGFDDEYFHSCKKREVRKKLGLPINKKIIITIGKLDERKKRRTLCNTRRRTTRERT